MANLQSLFEVFSCCVVQMDKVETAWKVEDSYKHEYVEIYICRDCRKFE